MKKTDVAKLDPGTIVRIKSDSQYHDSADVELADTEIRKIDVSYSAGWRSRVKTANAVLVRRRAGDHLSIDVADLLLAEPADDKLPYSKVEGKPTLAWVQIRHLTGVTWPTWEARDAAVEETQARADARADDAYRRRARTKAAAAELESRIPTSSTVMGSATNSQVVYWGPVTDALVKILVAHSETPEAPDVRIELNAEVLADQLGILHDPRPEGEKT